MGFQLVDYNLLAKYIKESIETEVKSHGFNPKNLQRSLRSLYKNHAERAIQCQYLLVVLDCLNKVDQEDKARVLNAAVYYVRAQIFDSYQGRLAALLLAPENSTLFNSLTTSLNLRIDNFPDSKDLLDMYVALENFMNAHVYKDSDSRKGYLEIEQQAFSADKIKDYEVEKDLKDLVAKIKNLKSEHIDKTKEQQLAKEVPVEQQPGVSLLGMFKPKTITSTTPVEPISQAPVVVGCN